MKYNVDEIQKNMHVPQVEGIGDRLEEDIRNILNRAEIRKTGVWIWGTRQEDAGSNWTACRCVLSG